MMVSTTVNQKNSPEIHTVQAQCAVALIFAYI